MLASLDLTAPIAAFTEPTAGAPGVRGATMTGTEYPGRIESTAQCAADGCSRNSDGEWPLSSAVCAHLPLSVPVARSGRNVALAL